MATKLIELEDAGLMRFPVSAPRILGLQPSPWPGNQPDGHGSACRIYQ